MVNLPSLRRHALPLVLLAILVVSLGVNIRLKDRPLIGGDLPDYLMQAWNLNHYGLLSQDISQPPRPGLGREPGYPLLLAALMRTTALGGFHPACLAQTELCPRAMFRPALAAGIAMGLAAAAALGWAAFRLTGWRWAGAVGFGYIALNAQMWSWRHFPQSDYLALLLACGLAALVAEWGLRQGLNQRRGWAVATGLCFGALIMVKAAFLWLLLPLLPAWALLRWRRPALLPRHAWLVLAVAALPPAMWMWRNGVQTGVFALTDARSGIALSTREVFDHMGLWDWLCAWVFWIRGFGDDLARALFPTAVWQPFMLDAPGGYYDVGQNRYAGLVQAVMVARGLATEAAQAVVDRDMVSALLAHPFGYLASLPVLFWRGIWIDEFVLLGLPALILLGRQAWRQGQVAWLLPLLPGMFNLIFYPAVSLNIPRYQITALPALGLAAAWAAWRLWPLAEARTRAVLARRA
jgi:hypothetical protein